MHGKYIYIYIYIYACKSSERERGGHGVHGTNNYKWILCVLSVLNMKEHKINTTNFPVYILTPFLGPGSPPMVFLRVEYLPIKKVDPRCKTILT